MIQPVMCVSAVVATTHRVMCAGVAAQMIQWVMMQMTTMAVIVQVVVDAVQMMPPAMTVAVIGRGRPMISHNSPAVLMTLSRPIVDKDEDRVAVADAAVMTPPAMTVADKVAAATIRAKFGLPAALDG